LPQNGPGYADIKDITVRLKGDLTSLTVKFFEPLPTGISLVGRLYVDYDANASTGCNWPNEKGADYLAVFTQTEGALFEWKKKQV